MRNKSKIILFIIAIIMFTLSSCKTSNRLVVNLITKSEASEEIEYVSIYSNGKAKTVDAFTSDDFQVYNAGSGSFFIIYL